MIQTHKGTSGHFNRITKPILVVAAMAGWGAFAYSSLLLGEVRKQLHGQAAVLGDYQVQYQQQRQAAADARAQMEPLNEQLAAERREVERLAKSQSELTADLTQANARLQSAQQQLDEQSRAALMHIPPRPTERDIVAAQEALTQLHFGPIKADGVIGEGTRQAVEEFQRVAGLTVTGELHAQTLQALLRMAKVVAAQEDHTQPAVQE